MVRYLASSAKHATTTAVASRHGKELSSLLAIYVRHSFMNQSIIHPTIICFLSLTSPIVPAIGRTTPPRLPRLRDKAFVTPDTDDRVPAEACLSKEETPRKVARTVEEGP